MNFHDSGFEELSELLDGFKVSEEDAIVALEESASMLVQDVRKLPRPRSSIRKAGYTHMLDTVAYQRDGNQVKVGWGKFYGLFLEYGTKKMGAHPHIVPTFQKNKDKYYKAIEKRLFG